MTIKMMDDTACFLALFAGPMLGFASAMFYLYKHYDTAGRTLRATRPEDDEDVNSATNGELDGCVQRNTNILSVHSPEC